MTTEILSYDEKIYFSIVSVLLVLFAGIFSGLTLALFSIDTMYLKVTAATGTPTEQRRARKLLPLLTRQHLTLVALLVSNASAMTALPIFLERLLNPVLALVVSVTAVLFFGEVIPQATFVKNAFVVGAFFAPFVWGCIIVTFIVSYPASLILDAIVGHKAEVMERDQLGEFLRMHGEDHPDAKSKLSIAEVNVMRGALILSTKKVKDLLKITPEKIFMLSSSTPLDCVTIEKILQSGFSRIPIFKDGDRKHILGILLVKTLLPLAFTNPCHPPLAGDYHLREVLRVSEETMVEDVYASFQGGQSHLAVVYNRRGFLCGILTLEEVFETLHSVSIEDEMDSSQRQPVEIDLRQRQLLELLSTVKHETHSKQLQIEK